jgi:RNA-binding protein
MSLSNSQKRYLRGLAHALTPVIMVGNKGLTAPLLGEFTAALDRHELVKVKLAGDDRDARKEQIDQLADSAQAEIVQRIGHVASFFRRNAEEPKIALPK